jgi:hypothetical protein
VVERDLCRQGVRIQEWTSYSYNDRCLPLRTWHIRVKIWDLPFSIERMDDVEADGEKRAELRHSICDASGDIWNPVRRHYGLHRKDIEIRNQARV